MAAAFYRPLIKNTTSVKEGEISSYKDLAKPRWKGEIILIDPPIPGGSNSMMAFLASVWGVEGLRDYLRQLMKQDLMVTMDLRQQMEWLARVEIEGHNTYCCSPVLSSPCQALANVGQT